MSNPFEGKTIFAHNIPATLEGNRTDIALWLVAHGFKTILVKCADGALGYSPWSDLLKAYVPNIDQDFVDVLHSFNIQVVGWGFNYGGDPEGEGLVAARICNRLGLDGWAFDIESRFETYADAVPRAGRLIGAFNHTIITPIPRAFCSWAFYWARSTGAQIHKPEIGRFMMDYCDVIMPMIYWNRTWFGIPVQMTDMQVLDYCNISTSQQYRITAKPVVPVLRAYTGDGGFANAGNILAAGEWARERFFGASWWFMDQAVKPEIAAALGGLLAWDGTMPDPPPVPQTIPAIPGPFRIISHREAGDGWFWPDAPLDAYPAATATKGGNGIVRLTAAWQYALRAVMTTAQWARTWVSQEGWHNSGDIGTVRQVEFAHNLKWVTGINADGWYEYDVYYNTDAPPNLAAPYDKYRRGIMTIDYKTGHESTGGVANSDLLLPYISIARDRTEKLRIDPKYLRSLISVPFACNVKTDGGRLNVRSAPSVGAVQTTIENSKEITVFAMRKVGNNAWGRITAPGSTEGWVALWLTTADV